MILPMREHGYCHSNQVMRQVATSMQPDLEKSVQRMGYGKLEHFLVSNSSWSRSLHVVT